MGGADDSQELPLLHLEPPLTAWPTPEEFEKYVYRLVKLLGRDLRNLRVEHLEKIEGYDGSYIFDVTARFTGFGHLDFVCLFECKRHKRPVERGDMMELHGKKESVGAQKAIMVSTAGFQSGAIEFARKHGIASVQIVDQVVRYLTNSANPPSPGRLLKPVRGRYATWLHHGREGGTGIDVAELHPDLIRQTLGLPIPAGTIVHEDPCRGCGEVAYLVGRRFHVNRRDGVVPIDELDDSH
ncbi:restriction endonuclease [Saccharothrix deserti]|uniref:restriction endonuclease n=1 Tax=Saccharothrix deserti TaxID=2593674 RepID=UPI00131B63C4|nr:restriction endonuclease [Saccharothrix deserti]